MSEPFPYPYSNNNTFFDPEISINSGQMFLWEKYDNSWYGIYGDYVLKLINSTSDWLIRKSETAFDDNNCGIRFLSFPRFPLWERQVFRLDDDLNEIFSSFPKDILVSKSLSRYPGLRLMRQEFDQCMISFVCASNTNISMIRRMLNSLCRKFGNKVIVDGKQFYTFPSAARLNRATDEELRLCGLGYRTKAVKAVAESIINGSLDRRYLLRLPYEEAKEELLKVYGIGNKVADCILLFSLDKLDAFPIDVWIARVLCQNYNWLLKQNEENFGIRDKTIAGEKMTAREYKIISKNVRNYFGKYCGYAQQYLYYDVRQSAGKKW